ncbi:uncharacterized protein [Diadema antillarum]|uniref:uncharacterized protein n=1 Tax=Diadema antillarum TaxID=105358 RepID=UPI003A8A908A
MNREVGKKMKAAKENWIEAQCKVIDKGLTAGNIKEAYNTLKTLTKTSQPKSPVIDDKDGNLLTNSEEILKRWTEYCSDLYNNTLQLDTSIQADIQIKDDEEDGPSVIKDEVKKAILSLKPVKSPVVDNVPTELLKCGGEATVKALTALCQKIWEEKKWPREWIQSLIIPLQKKGSVKITGP